MKKGARNFAKYNFCGFLFRFGFLGAPAEAREDQEAVGNQRPNTPMPPGGQQVSTQEALRRPEKRPEQLRRSFPPRRGRTREGEGGL